MGGQSNPGIPVDLRLQQFLLSRESRLKSYIQGRIPGRLAGTLSAEDILQEVLMQVFLKPPPVRDDDPESFDRWLYRVANSKLVDAVRAADRMRRGGPAGESNPRERERLSAVDAQGRIAARGRTPSSDAAGSEAAGKVRNEILRLPEHEGWVVRLFHLEGKTIEEIAEILELPQSRVRYLLVSGRRALRRRLGPAADFFTDARSVELSTDAEESEERDTR